MGERRDAAVHHRPGGVEIGMAPDAHVRPERQLGRIAAGVVGGGAGERNPPRDTIRIGAEGESYPGIRKDDVNVGGRITVADDTGAFGNPTSDSARTMVTPSSTELLIVVYAPAEIGKAQLERVVSTTAERFAQITGGSEAGRAL